jgi:hypothetical protein
VKPVTQKEAEELLVNYIVNSLSPINHVEHPSFVQLVQGLAPHIQTLSRQTVSRRIQDRQLTMKTKLKEAIMQTDYICITADAWSGFHNRRSFMGITCHMLDTDLQRRSFALACRLFPGSHSYDRIAKLMSDILKEYDIPVEKITCCVTDNGSNFVKAFKEFHVEVLTNEQSDDEEVAEGETEVEIDLHNLAGAGDTQTSQRTEHEQLDASEDDMEDDLVVLPSHQRCASHTLNLVGCNAPTSAAAVNAKYRSILYSSNAKLSAIWNKVNSPKSNEIILSVLGSQVVTPVPTRWNSYYDARRSLLLHGSDKINTLCVGLGLPAFKDVEYAFMKEEMQVLTPLAEGLDRLQGQSNPESYMAFLFPTLLQLRHIYQELSSNRSQTLKHCSYLASVILKDISTRFQEYFEFGQSSEAAVLATISHPAFKLRWLSSQSSDIVERMKSLFMCALQDVSATQQLQQNSDRSSKSNDLLDSNTLDFFTFMNTDDNSASTNTQSQVELQGLQYLEDSDKLLSSLDRYPLVCKLFRFVLCIFVFENLNR